jgi:hypothetical protein
VSAAVDRAGGAIGSAPMLGRRPVFCLLSCSSAIVSDRIHWRSDILVEHDLFGKPDSTFPDHALEAAWWSMIFSENRIPLFRIML